MTRSRTGTLTVDGNPITGVANVTAIVVSHLDGRPVALAGDRAGLVRIWDLAGRHRISDELNVGAPVFAIAATIDGKLAVGAGGRVYASAAMVAISVRSAVTGGNMRYGAISRRHLRAPK